MSGGQDERDADRSTAGPVVGDGGALRARASSAPPSPTPPAEEQSAQDKPGPAAQAAGEAGDKAVEQDLDALLADTQRERDEYLELAKRTKADFENFRKRMNSEVAAAGLRGKAALIGELVHVIDNLERALDAAGIDPSDGSTPEEPLAHGVVLTYRDLCQALKGNGVESLDPSGDRFDPQWHEALTTKPGDGQEAGVVLEVVQKGYRLGEQLIRPARVVVAE